VNLEEPPFQLFANLALIWVLANYFPAGHIDASVRSHRVLATLRLVTVLFGSWFACGWKDGWVIALPLCAGTAGLLIARDTIARRYLAELESVNVIALAGTAWAIRHLSLTLHPLIQLAAVRNEIPAALLTAAILCYTLRGGNYIVRGFLEKGALIPAEPAAVPDEQKVRHGRMIGYLERIVIIAAITAGSFEALGFLVAAKGLIRAKEFDRKEFAEYFLVGSLTSILVSIVAGTMVRALIRGVAPGGLADFFR
jgi:hypothetical protein